MEGQRDRSQVYFLLALALLSALAIWFVEEERPRQEAVRMAATRTQIAVSRRAATTRARQIATTEARQTAATTTRTRQTATTRARQTATGPVNAHLTANAENRQTATAFAQQNVRAANPHTATARAYRTSAAVYRQTAVIALTGTADAATATSRAIFARQTWTQRAATSAAHVRSTATVRAERTSVAALRRTEAAALAPTFAARARQTVTARVQQTAAAASPTPSPPPSATLEYRPLAAEIFYVNQQAGVNARACPRHATAPCEIVAKLRYGTAVRVVGEAEGEVYLGRALWKIIEWGGRRPYIHASLLSREPPPPLDDGAGAASP